MSQTPGPRPSSASTGLGYGFEPDAGRAAQLDRRMRRQLSDSLSYVTGELQKHLPLGVEAITRFLARLEKGPTPPISFAIYADIIQAIDQDDLAEAGTLLDLLLEQTEATGGLDILELGDPRTDPRTARYIRYIDCDPDVPLGLIPPSPEAAEQTRRQIHEALELIEEGDPRLAAELRELLREIVLCASRQSGDTYTFDGASSFLLWGAIFINAERKGARLDMVQMLAHESAHNLLFGLCPDEPLLTNDATERYPSPLRLDPRPLEGIYHATFVTARMHRAMRQMAKSGILGREETASALGDAARNKASFEDGLKTLDAHAHLTETGRRILEGAREYMRSA